MSELRFYHLYRAEGEETDYDETIALVVAAESPEEARQLVMDAHCYGAEGGVWLLPDRTRCVEIGTAKSVEKGVICRDFHAG